MNVQMRNPGRVVRLAIAVSLVSTAIVAQPVDNRQWQIAGHDLNNWRNQPTETRIGVANVSQLVAKWVFETGSDVSATPTVSDNTVYFPDWAGNLYAVRADTGTLLWSQQIASYTAGPEASRV